MYRLLRYRFSNTMESVVKAFPSIALSQVFLSGIFNLVYPFADLTRPARDRTPTELMLPRQHTRCEGVRNFWVVLTQQECVVILMFFESADPRGKTYYWLAGGELLEDVEPDKVASRHPTYDVQAVTTTYCDALAKHN